MLYEKELGWVAGGISGFLANITDSEQINESSEQDELTFNLNTFMTSKTVFSVCKGSGLLDNLLFFKPDLVVTNYDAYKGSEIDQFDLLLFSKKS